MIRCVIVDDSPLALDLLEDYISKVDELHLIRKFTNALEAIPFIESKNIELVFLDIHMPDISGMDLLKKLIKKPKIIFTTAFPNYAVAGFELDAVDYLLKPFSFDRFKKAADKAVSLIHTSGIKKNEEAFIYVKSGYDKVKINIREIHYIEALKDYIKIYTGEKKVLSLMSMKEILELLPKDEFVRTHRSYIIAVNKIKRVSSKSVLLENKEVPVGAMYRKEFVRFLESRNI
jgi:DNA-binding LytR/AlgR family response regulator